MPRAQTSRAARHLTAWFVAATVLPLAGLVWLGWTIVEQDRVAEQERIGERRDQALGVAAEALQRKLAEIEEGLTLVASSDDVHAGVAAFGADPGAALVVFDRRGLIERSGMALPYYPDRASPGTSGPFNAADEKEFANDPVGAIAALQPLERAGEPAVRAEALLRLARNHTKKGDTASALDAFDKLGALEDVRAIDRPAGLAARQGRGLLLHHAARTAELRQEAAALIADLDRGRWTLTKAQYDFARDQAIRWTAEADAPSVIPDSLALAAATEAAWRSWKSAIAAEPAEPQQRLLRATDGSALVLARATADRLAILVVGRRFLDATWLGEAQAADPEVDIALTNANEAVVLGQAEAPVEKRSARIVPLTSPPWTVYAVTTGSASSVLSSTARLSLAAVALTAVMLLVSAYVISRAVSREVSVAALQSDFVAAVSHEFRTPLTTIRQLSELLTRGRVSTEPRRQQFYETLLRESDRLHRLVESLLDFGRMEARAVEYRFDRLEPEPFVREIVTDFQQQIDAGFVVDLRVRGPLPAIRADRGSLSRVFWNLLDNAAKYSPEHRSVQVDVECADAHLLVHVRDRGIGIPPEEQASIFGKFVRGAHARLASIKGTGLGLAMASRIVEAHGGRITVESAVGVGSTFTVLLPIMEPA